MELQPIESSIQLSSSSSKNDRNSSYYSKSFLHCLTSSLSKSTHLSNAFISNDNSQKRSARIIGKRGKRDTEFLHPSSLAYSKQDQLICKFSYREFLFV